MSFIVHKRGTTHNICIPSLDLLKLRQQFYFLSTKSILDFFQIENSGRKYIKCHSDIKICLLTVYDTLPTFGEPKKEAF